MPIMTDPLAHIEVLLSDTKAGIEKLNMDGLKISAKLEVMYELHSKIDAALAHERKKLSAHSGDQ